MDNAVFFERICRSSKNKALIGGLKKVLCMIRRWESSFIDDIVFNLPPYYRIRLG